jgi:hypothetical protein
VQETFSPIGFIRRSLYWRPFPISPGARPAAILRSPSGTRAAYYLSGERYPQEWSITLWISRGSVASGAGTVLPIEHFLKIKQAFYCVLRWLSRPLT